MKKWRDHVLSCAPLHLGGMALLQPYLLLSGLWVVTLKGIGVSQSFLLQSLLLVSSCPSGHKNQCDILTKALRPREPSLSPRKATSARELGVAQGELV